MLVVAKTPPIRLEVFGEGMEALAEILKREIPDIVITPEPGDDAGETENVFETEWYKKMAATWHPGHTVAIKREHLGLTQAQLSEKTGISIPNISLIENGRRNVGVRTVKRLAEALGISVERLLRP